MIEKLRSGSLGNYLWR